MTEKFLNIIRVESEKEIANLGDFNFCARNSIQAEMIEEIRKIFGLSYNGNIGTIEKNEFDVIMSVYRKYHSNINEVDTNGIYVYVGTYMPSGYSSLEIENGYPFEMEVDMNDSRATHRRYWNIEGIWAKTIDIEDCMEFEKTHIVIYANNFYEVQKDFVITAVKDNQEKAVNRLIKKYRK